MLAYILLFLVSSAIGSSCAFWARKTGRDPMVWFVLGFAMNALVFLVIREVRRSPVLIARAR